MRRYKSLIFYGASVLLLSLAYLASPMSRETLWQLFPGLEAMARANPLATALTFLAMSAVLTFLAFPSMPMIYTAAGFYIDGLAGGTTVLFGSTLGGLSAFLFYRKRIRERSDLLLKQSSVTKIWLTLLGLRLSPLVPAPLVNFFAAVFDASPLQYLTTNVLGGAPLVLFYAQIGQQGHQFLSGDMPHWWQFSGYLVILGVSTVLSAMGPWRSVLNEIKQINGSSGSTTLPFHLVNKSPEI